jgi:phosphoesterase RecJ-like protein
MSYLPPLSAKHRSAVARIAEVFKNKKSFFLTGHERPDGDTIGSELALASYLRGQGKKVTVANVGPVPPVFHFLVGARRVRTAPRVKGHFDAAVVFECSGPERMGHIIDIKTQADCVINIDHHAHHGDFGHINLVDPGASSNSEQLCQIFSRVKHRLTKNEATALYVGLVTDTGRFQQENTRPQSHWVAALLLQAGVDVADVWRRIYATRSPAALKLMSRALGSLRMELGGRVSVLRLSRKDFLETGAREDDTEDVVNQGLLPPSAWVSLFLREVDGKKEVKASLRGKGKVDLCRLAVSLGGGGHKNASGVTLPGSLDGVELQLMKALSLAMGR